MNSSLKNVLGIFYTPLRRPLMNRALWAREPPVHLTRLCSTKSKGTKLREVNKSDNDIVNLTFEDSSRGAAPFVWLRDNCQCPSCFDSGALQRKITMVDFNFEAKPSKIEFDENRLSITWSDSHVSTFDSKWLHRRAFNPVSKGEHDRFCDLTKKPWGKCFSPQEFNYEDLISDEKVLLKWLVTLEVEGATLVKNAMQPGDGANLSDHVAMVRLTHYGRISHVNYREPRNSVAFSNEKLGLHNDVVCYQHLPGVIALHFVKQETKGGQSLISDGLYAAEVMRKHHPREFELLTTKDIYFWDKGTPDIFEEKNFFKTCKSPIIKLDANSKVETIRFSNHMRDSFMDMSPTEVKDFYYAMKVFNDSLYEYSYSYKAKNGEILHLDNCRCMHGREAYESSRSRLLENSYMDWDEAKCRRRQLMEKFGIRFSSDSDATELLQQRQ